MRALGHLLVILGLTVAAFALRPADKLDDAGVRPPDKAGSIEASAAVPAASVLQVVYVPTRRAVVVLTAMAGQASGTPSLDLVRQILDPQPRRGLMDGGRSRRPM
jgi:hypothetical protein